MDRPPTDSIVFVCISFCSVDKNMVYCCFSIANFNEKYI